MSLTVSQLFIYPIKSFGGISLTRCNVEPRGLQYDRRWMLIDSNGRFISQRENALLALFRIQLFDDKLEVRIFNDPIHEITIPFFNSIALSYLPRIKVTIWDDVCDAVEYPATINQWFSKILDQPCSLVYMPDESIRRIDPDYGVPGEITSLSDGFPVLLIGQASLDDLNKRLINPIPIQRFRPNIVFEGGSPYQEDMIHNFSIHDCRMKGSKLCARCNIPTIDQETALSNQEPTATLATYRLFDKKILFGQNVIIKSLGEIHVGDELIIEGD
ncbi:MAG: MOSC N-terminal beta barrel domain-containing protein [Saprospiraceae bacterium]